MKVYTYFDPTVQQCGLPPQDGVIRLWAESWKKFGWTPRVLTDRMARMHPLFDKFLAKVSSFPSVNPRAYENACYLRWLALQNEGGGWMVDYDVINFGFRPRQGKGEVEMLDPTYVPCAVWANKFGISRIAGFLTSHRPKEDHVSDMTIFKTQFERKKLGPAGNTVIEYAAPGWEHAPLVHFSAGKCTNFPSKVDAIRSASQYHA